MFCRKGRGARGGGGLCYAKTAVFGPWLDWSVGKFKDGLITIKLRNLFLSESRSRPKSSRLKYGFLMRWGDKGDQRYLIKLSSKETSQRTRIEMGSEERELNLRFLLNFDFFDAQPARAAKKKKGGGNIVANCWTKWTRSPPRLTATMLPFLSSLPFFFPQFSGRRESQMNEKVMDLGWKMISSITIIELEQFV